MPSFDLDRAASRLDDAEHRWAATPWWDYPRLDREHRSRTLSIPDWFPDWHLARPDDVGHLAAHSGRPLVAAALLSMHPDGHVREAAVRVLAAVVDPAAVPFLLVRAGDWVEPVRRRAQAAILARAQHPAGADALLPAVPLLERLAAGTTRSGEFAADVLVRLAADLSTPALVAGLSHGDRRVRRGSARLLAGRGEVTGEALAAALRQHEVVTAVIVGTAALDRAPTDAVRAALWGSSIAPLRLLVLHRAQAGEAGETGESGDDPMAPTLSDAGLFDRSPSVRLLAQQHLAGRGADLRRRYEAALPGQVVALRGLAEVARPHEADEVAAVVAPYLADERARAREFAVQATGTLLGAASRPVVLAVLDDPSPAVVRAAGRALERQGLDPAALDDLWARAQATDRAVVRRAVFDVFLRQSRWPQLVLACRALTAADDDLRHRGQLLLRAAYAGWHHAFTRPSSAELDELDRLAPEAAADLPPATARALLALLRR
jgi:hypothetical protein